MSMETPLDAVSPWAAQFSRRADEVLADLERFHALLEKWQKAQNLVSRETLAAFWTRHVADSLQVLPLLPPGSVRIFDLGSGGGFPGLPLAIALKGSGARFLLCDSNQRKTAFLRTAIREMGLDAEVVTGRIETLVSRETPRAEVILARALAPLNHLFELGFPLLSTGGHMIVHKGRENGTEIDAAGAGWRFDVVRKTSAIDADGVLLDISNLERRT